MKKREESMKSKTDLSDHEIEEIIKKCDVCNLAMVDSFNLPYVVPMNFGYEEGVIYFHGSSAGKKVEVLTLNNTVCVSFSTDHELRWQNDNVACSYSMKYRSVVAHGKVFFIDTPEDKINALNIIMKNYTERTFKYNDPAVRDVNVFKVIVYKLEGRVYGY
jgi:nitroimidazol reductase NimA-like FMN-containing flavoprotein (pyridoxamine 5'-phosphate oxidase superfamily)